MHEDDKSGCGFFQSRTGIAVLVFGAIIAFFLITEHQAHLWGWLPFLLLLACPLMHIFMHGGHGGHAGHGHRHGEQGKQPPPVDSGAARAQRPARDPGDGA